MRLDEVINRLIKAYNYKSYMEVGIDFGNTFRAVVAERSIGIDPRIATLEYGERKDVSGNKSFFKLKSDDYFKDQHEKVDIVLVDGMHTYEQALRDIYNAFNILNDGGVVLVHDVDPGNEIEALHADKFFPEVFSSGKYMGGWTGDVWKAILHIRMLHDDIEVSTFKMQYGLSLLRKGVNIRLPEEKVLIKDLPYEYFKKMREYILNFKEDDEIIKGASN